LVLLLYGVPTTIHGSFKDAKTGMDILKATFKRYKSKNLSDYSDVIEPKDFRTPDLSIIIDDSCKAWLKPVSEWKVFDLPQCPGFTIIRDIFTAAGQRYWIEQCLVDFTRTPNITNLDVLGAPAADRNCLWKHHLERGIEKKCLLDKLRWVTLGYHHNWDTKVYSNDMYTPFPDNLGQLSSLVARVVGCHDFKAEAAIVNYYHMDSTLAPHTDHSEIDQTPPLMSISFGQSAIFLLGGETRDVQPIAVYLHSGDVAIMAGPSRLAYHAVPRVIQCGLKPWLADCCESWTDMDKYLETSRINMNIRQVYPSSTS